MTIDQAPVAVMSGRGSAAPRLGLLLTALLRRVIAVVGQQWRRLLKFLAVGASGVFVNIAIMWAAMGFGMHYLLASVIATELSILWNFWLYESIVFRDRRAASKLWVRACKNFLYNNLEYLARVPLLVFAVHLGMNGLFAQFITLVLAFFARFAFNSLVVYRAAPISAAAPGPVRVSGSVDDAALT